MHVHLLSVVALLALAACNTAPRDVAVTDAYVRLAAVTGRPAAGYLSIRGGGAPDRLVGVDSPDSGPIELHASMKGAGGTMTMTPLSGIDIPAGGTVALAPAGYHAMIFGVPARIRPGAVLRLRLRFASGRRLVVPARTIAAGDEAP